MQDNRNSNHTTNILIVCGILALLWLGGCFPSAQANTTAPQPQISPQDCYNRASDIVSPAWAELNTIQRSVLFFEIANTCEGK